MDYVKRVRVTSLTAIFGSSEEKTQEDSEKLLQLYWNRAELKKEFADLRNEKYRLQERVKEQQGVTARIEQKLDQLEQLLLDPDWVYNVAIHYQLDHLNLRCQNRLEVFAEQLKQHREHDQYSRLLAEWDAAREQEAEEVRQRVGEHRIQVQTLEDRLQAEQHRLVTMNALVRFCRKRSATAALDQIAAAIDAVQQAEHELMQHLDAVESREPPDVQGLDITVKRTINFSILAYAQQLYLQLRHEELAELAKVAADRSAGAINYGGKEECDRILALVKAAAGQLGTSKGGTDLLRERAKLIAQKAQFRSDEDAVPEAASVATVFDIDRDGCVKEIDTNLLGEDYWNLSGILSR